MKTLAPFRNCALSSNLAYLSATFKTLAEKINITTDEGKKLSVLRQTKLPKQGNPVVRRLNANLEVKGYPQELILITHEPKWVHKRKRLSAKLRWVVASYGESGETIIDIIKRLHDREKLNFRQIATMLKVSDSTLLT